MAVPCQAAICFDCYPFHCMDWQRRPRSPRTSRERCMCLWRLPTMRTRGLFRYWHRWGMATTRAEICIGARLSAFGPTSKGQAMRFHKPPVSSLEGGQRMMFVSRHIYILGSALVNLVLGTYLKMENRGWRRNLQVAGSLLILISPVLLTPAFEDEPGTGIAGRSLRSAFGWFTLLAGALTHFLVKIGAGRELTGPVAASKLIKLCAGVAHW